MLTKASVATSKWITNILQVTLENLIAIVQYFKYVLTTFSVLVINLINNIAKVQ